jgi:hypothetical protein
VVPCALRPTPCSHGALVITALLKPSLHARPSNNAQERWGEAAKRLAAVLNDDTFRSIEGKSKHQLWLELCDLITKHPAEVLAEGIDVDAILRGGIRKYKDEVRRLSVTSSDVTFLVTFDAGGAR